MKLLEPIEIGSLKLKNRIVFPAIASAYATTTGFVTDAMIAYYKNIAKNCALCIVEAVCVDWEGRIVPRQLWVCDDRFVPGLTRLAEGIHDVGAKAAMQISHAGIVAYFSGLEKTWGPSKAQYPIWDPTVTERIQELSTGQVEHIIDEFGEAAARAKAAGYDAVEIHGCHGYLFTQFLSPEINTRTDRFGSDLEGRMRFSLEVVKSVRDAVGPTFPVIYRMNADDRVEEAHRLQWGTDTLGFTLDSGKTLARRVEEAGVDVIHVTSGTYDALAWEVQPSDLPHMCLADLSAAIKAEVTIPVIAVGRITTPEMAEEILQDGKADLVSIGRGLIADDEWYQKAEEGRSREIQQCIGCMECMRRAVFMAQELPCTVNYKISRESSYSVAPASKAKRILVVGGGPAGMTAARYAAARGHDVTIYEKQDSLGGEWRYAAMMPGCADFSNYAEQCSLLLKRYDVKVNLGTEVTPELVDELKPDAVIVATGGVSLTPNLPGVDQANVLNYSDVLSGKVSTGQDIVIWCSTACCKTLSFLGCRVADHLASKGKNVAIVSTKPYLVDTMMPHSSGPMFWRFARAGVKILNNTRLREISGFRVETEGAEGVQYLRADSVVLTNVRRPNNALAEALKKRVPEIVVVGDAAEVSNFFHATRDGARVGLEI
jgi:2,4-dienoyl-CoA reductase-like NADH-dependent reductase (Old Yellow Enzyme family)